MSITPTRAPLRVGMGDDEGLRAVRERVETLRRPEPAAMDALVDALRLTEEGEA